MSDIALQTIPCHLMGLANLIARHSEQRLNEKEPLLSGVLPSGHRIQIILPPATKSNSIVISIRKQTLKHVRLDEYEQIGIFQNITHQGTSINVFVARVLDFQQVLLNQNPS